MRVMAAGQQSIEFTLIERSELRLAIQAALTGGESAGRRPLMEAYRKLARADGMDGAAPFERVGIAAERVVERAANAADRFRAAVDDEIQHVARAATGLDGHLKRLMGRSLPEASGR